MSRKYGKDVVLYLKNWSSEVPGCLGGGGPLCGSEEKGTSANINEQNLGKGGERGERRTRSNLERKTE